MKKRFLILILALVILSYCGGVKPETQPVKPTTPTQPAEETKTSEPPTQTQDQVETPVTENKTVEIETTGEEEDKRTPITAEDGRKFQKESIDVKPINNEVIPVIEPEKKPDKLETAEMAKIKNLMESITSGITGIFREFGYSGNIDVPENFKKRVAYYIHFFSKNERGAELYLRGMSRGSQYFPMIQRILKEKHLPRSLAYLPLIESGFNPNARSRAGAVGMWQFMRGTARMYGLKITRSIDERKDPIKSTYAAAEYLNDLLAMFGLEDPFLGICAFNAGEGKILRALRNISYTERSFWTLVKKDLLKNETNEYIPQFLAVILMAGSPDKYAAVPHEVSLEPEEVKTDEEKDQEIINTLHHSDSKDNLGEENNEIPTPKPLQPAPQKKTTINTPQVYKVKRGDTLYSIARRYNIGVNTLKKWNGLRSNRIHPGQKLEIQSPGTIPGNSTGATPSKGYELTYTVNYTDSLARIALFFPGVSARDIMKWNRLKRTRIYPKQKLVLYLDEAPRQVLTHTVKRGESAFKIARKYNIRVEFVLSLNGLVTNSRLQPGQKLKIYYF